MMLVTEMCPRYHAVPKVEVIPSHTKSMVHCPVPGGAKAAHERRGRLSSILQYVVCYTYCLQRQEHLEMRQPNLVWTATKRRHTHIQHVMFTT
jgi:hypothetical protein